LFDLPNGFVVPEGAILAGRRQRLKSPRVFQQALVRGDDGSSAWFPLHVSAVSMKVPRLTVVSETGLEQSAHALMQTAIFDRRDDLDSAIEVAGHPIR
jgi:hypothetical protein